MRLAFVFLLCLLVGPVHAATSPVASPVASLVTSPIPYASFRQRPRLVVALVIDQFRADYLTRFEKRFMPAVGKGGELGGFAWLMTNGAYFANAHYDVLQCMTAPGHSMILSGSYPYVNGISLNDWWDRKQGKAVYATEDPDSPIVGRVVKSDKGMSPKNLGGTTVGDELKNAGLASRVVAVALKDRASILLGGHRADLAIWLSDAFQWVSSKHYVKELPEWVAALNRTLDKKKGTTFVWQNEGAASGLSDDGDAKTGPWRHDVEVTEKTAFNTAIGAELTADAALAAVDAYHLGEGAATDLLAVSLSAHDYAGHENGANSRLMEEMTVSEDRALSRLFNALKKRLPGGLKDVVITLTADHGVSPRVGYLSDHGIEAGTINTKEVMAGLETALSSKFGKPSIPWVDSGISFNFYFNPKAAAERKASFSDVQVEAKRFLLGVKGVAFVFTRDEYDSGRLPPNQFERQIKKSYLPANNGDVLLIPKPFYHTAGPVAQHMTGYAYDRTVPLILVGPRFKPGVYSTSADVVDLAPTLSFVLGVLPPALSEGRVLSEALR